MARPVNPFRPGSPVNPEMFVGRLSEVEQLEASLLQTRADHPSHFMLTGERGIGKTSLLHYVRYFARGDIDLGDKLRFLVVDCDLDSSTTQISLVKRIEASLRRRLAKDEKTRNFFKTSWDFIQRLEIADSRLREKGEPEHQDILVDEFVNSLAALCERICGGDEKLFAAQYDGVLILIDEADNSSKDIHLGSFLKLASERLEREGCTRVSFGLAGLPELRDVLQESHPSSLRILNEIVLNRLSDSEVSRVIDRAIERGNEINAKETQISDDGRSLLISLSEGYPHFIQQFGYCAFEKNDNGVITQDDVFSGAFDPRGGLDLIGDRYYRSNFYQKIQQESYRQVLRIMADQLDSWVSKKAIRKEFKGKESTLNNAIQALRRRHIILSKEGKQGVYRLQHRGFALWIKLRAQRRE